MPEYAKPDPARDLLRYKQLELHELFLRPSYVQADFDVALQMELMWKPITDESGIKQDVKKSMEIVL